MARKVPLEARGDISESGSHEHRVGSRPVSGKSRRPGDEGKVAASAPFLSSPAACKPTDKLRSGSAALP